MKFDISLHNCSLLSGLASQKRHPQHLLFMTLAFVLKSTLVQSCIIPWRHPLKVELLKMMKYLSSIAVQSQNLFMSHMLPYAWNESCWALHENNALKIYFLLLQAFLTFCWVHSNQCIPLYTKVSDAVTSSTHLALCHGLRIEIGT